MSSSSRAGVVALIVAVVTRLPVARAGLIDHRVKESDETNVIDNGGFMRGLSVIELNEFLFTGNVIDCSGKTRGGNVDHWIVAFCPRWYSVCQKLLPIFQNVSRHWEDELNSNIVMRTPVRFGLVDCATDKELCNDENVEGYPTVVHYQSGEQTSQWTGYSMAQLKGFDKWVQNELSKGVAPRFEDVEPVEVSYIALVLFITFFAWAIWIIVHGAGLLTWAYARPKEDGEHLPSSSRQEDAPGRASAAIVKAPADVRTKAARCMPAEWVPAKASIEL